MNCETIFNDLMQMSWEIRHPDIYIQLEGKVGESEEAQKSQPKDIHVIDLQSQSLLYLPVTLSREPAQQND